MPNLILPGFFGAFQLAWWGLTDSEVVLESLHGTRVMCLLSFGTDA